MVYPVFAWLEIAERLIVAGDGALGAPLPAETSAAGPSPAPQRQGYLLVYGDATGPTACGTVIIIEQAGGSWLVRPDPTSAEGWLAD